MLVPLRRVRHSIDILQKNIYEYHHGSSLSLSTNSVRPPSSTRVQSSRRCQNLIQFIEDSCTIIQALFVRFIFILSIIITVWRLVEETKQVYYWYLLLLLIFLLIETYATVYTRKGYEYKWFCPSAFAYLIAIVPCIWLLELNQSYYSSSVSNQTRIALTIPRRFEFLSSTTAYPYEDFHKDELTNKDDGDSTETKITNEDLREADITIGDSTETNITNDDSTEMNITNDDSIETNIANEDSTMIRSKRALSTVLTTAKTQDLRLEELLRTPQKFMSKLNKHLSPEEWHMIIEQTTLLVLILSRWLLPKGELTREELSQLLLVYIGIAADIVEFFEVFKEKQVRTNAKLSILVLSLWTLSLLQFCLAFTISRGRKTRQDLKEVDEKRFFCSPSDFWGMLLSLFLQDIPFFSFRAVLIFHYHILSYSTVFFTSKNGLIIILQWYRITVILAATIAQERHHHRKILRIIQDNNIEGTINPNENLNV